MTSDVNLSSNLIIFWCNFPFQNMIQPKPIMSLSRDLMSPAWLTWVFILPKHILESWLLLTLFPILPNWWSKPHNPRRERKRSIKIDKASNYKTRLIESTTLFLNPFHIYFQSQLLRKFDTPSLSAIEIIFIAHRAQRAMISPCSKVRDVKVSTPLFQKHG